MSLDLYKSISELTACKSPSGFEGSAAEHIKNIMLSYTDEVRTDALGNVIGVKYCGKSGAKKLLLDAHMDEIGLIVTGIDEGFLRFASLGGVDKRLLPALDVSVLCEDGEIPGVITCMPPHALAANASDKAFDELRIDIGMTAEQAKEKVKLGTPVVFTTKCSILGKNYICSKSLDDRACVAIILDAVSRIKVEDLNVDLYVMASTQEELGCRGAKAGVFSINPDYAIAVDVTHGHTPDAKESETLKIGAGVAIGVGPNMNRAMSNRLIKISEEQSIPYQIEVMAGNTGTNAWVMQVSREGVCTAVVSLPLKYMHTPVETIKLSDAEAVVSLLTEFVVSIGEDGLI